MTLLAMCRHCEISIEQDADRGWFPCCPRCGSLLVSPVEGDSLILASAIVNHRWWDREQADAMRNQGGSA